MDVPASKRLAILPGKRVVASTAAARVSVYRVVSAARDRRFVSVDQGTWRACASVRFSGLAAALGALHRPAREARIRAQR